MKREPIQERIRRHWRRRISYHELLNAVFPQAEYPKAHRISNNGGPPGCAMALGAAIRRMGGHRCSNGTVWIPPQV